jgi:hypothetical protein
VENKINEGKAAPPTCGAAFPTKNIDKETIFKQPVKNLKAAPEVAGAAFPKNLGGAGKNKAPEVDGAAFPKKHEVVKIRNIF